MQRCVLSAVTSLAFVAAIFYVVETAEALDRLKFPYSPISYHSLPFLVAYEGSSSRSTVWKWIRYSPGLRR